MTRKTKGKIRIARHHDIVTDTIEDELNEQEKYKRQQADVNKKQEMK